MKVVWNVLFVGLVVGQAWGCAAPESIAPVILYPGPHRGAEEVAVIEIARTGQAKGAPTLNVRRITRLEPNPEVLYRVEAGQAWTPPEHFGGFQATQSEGPKRDTKSLPDRFELTPGLYQVEFLYVPLLGRWGETHMPQGGSITTLECQGGRIYILRGRLDEEESRFFLSTTVLVSREGS